MGQAAQSLSSKLALEFLMDGELCLHRIQNAAHSLPEMDVHCDELRGLAKDGVPLLERRPCAGATVRTA
jgi:hypothetical protein